jgi:hypothetical protein
MIIDPRESAAKAAAQAVMMKIASALEGEKLDAVAGALMSLLLAVCQQLLEMRKRDRIVSLGAAGDDAIIRAAMLKWSEMLRAMSEHPDPQLLPELRSIVERMKQTSGSN